MHMISSKINKHLIHGNIGNRKHTRSGWNPKKEAMEFHRKRRETINEKGTEWKYYVKPRNT